MPGQNPAGNVDGFKLAGQLSQAANWQSAALTLREKLNAVGRYVPEAAGQRTPGAGPVLAASSFCRTERVFTQS